MRKETESRFMTIIEAIVAFAIVVKIFLLFR